MKEVAGFAQVPEKMERETVRVTPARFYHGLHRGPFVELSDGPVSVERDNRAKST